jgi:hypothetical protein
MLRRSGCSCFITTQATTTGPWRVSWIRLGEPSRTPRLLRKAAWLELDVENAKRLICPPAYAWRFSVEAEQ